MQDEIARLEKPLFEMCLELQNMRAKRKSEHVRNYTFQTEHGETNGGECGCIRLAERARMSDV